MTFGNRKIDCCLHSHVISDLSQAVLNISLDGAREIPFPASDSEIERMNCELQPHTAYFDAWMLRKMRLMISSTSRFLRLFRSMKLAHKALLLRAITSNRSDTVLPSISIFKTDKSDLLKYSNLPVVRLKEKTRNGEFKGVLLDFSAEELSPSELKVCVVAARGNVGIQIAVVRDHSGNRSDSRRNDDIFDQHRVRRESENIRDFDMSFKQSGLTHHCHW